MIFDEEIDRRGTHSSKWDMMQKIYGVSPQDGLAMWVADTDFRPPQCVQDAMDAYVAHGVYGYFGDDAAYRQSICWWMKTRHNWDVEPNHIFTTHGLVNGTAICIDAFTQPGDGVVLFTPVYHSFAKIIRGSGRKLVECDLINNEGQYELDFAGWDKQMTGGEKLLILCSPHNPGGRVWTRDELQGIADFAKRHDLIIVSDEIHHDIVYPGHTHIPMANIDAGIAERLVMLTATSKTFNIAGLHSGNVIIADDDLRRRFAGRMLGLGISPNAPGLWATTAAYSAQGAAWTDELVAYLGTNQQLFNEALATIPGVKPMQLQSTFLAWVDFSDTGMGMQEIHARVQKTARIAANHGETFGSGGEHFLRFNLGMPRARITEAIERLQSAFADLQ